MDILKKIKSKLAGLTSGVRLTPISTRDERPMMTAGLDADQVAGIIRASENGNSARFWDLCRSVILADGHIQAELFKRKNAVLGDDLIVTPWDKSNPSDVEAADAVEAMLTNISGLFDVNSHLMEAVIFPLSIVEKVFGPADPAHPELGRRYALKELVAVPHRLIGWDVNGHPVVTERGELGGFQNVPPLDKDRYIVHRGHLLSAPDRFGGPMRAIFFLWLLSAMSTTWWARYLERYGAPFIVGRVDSEDDRDRRVLESAISLATQLGGLVVSNVSTVDLKEAARDSGAGFEAFKAHCRREISRLILGQTLSSEASPTGLGSGVAGLQGDVRDDIRKFDSRRMGTTLREQLVEQWLRLNGYTGRAPTLSFAGDTTEEVKRTAELLGNLSSANLEPTDDALGPIGERIGFPIQRKSQMGIYPFSAVAPEGGSTAFFRRETYRG